MNPWNILVVDDEPLNLEIIAEYLEGGPYRLDTAEAGAAAWDLLQDASAAYDLVILDRMMPGMDGIALLQLLKASTRHATIPVIMQTAATAPAQIREGFAAGCYYYLTKPYTGNALLGIVHAALEEVRLSRTLAAALALPPAAPAVSGAEYAFATPEEARRLATLLAAQCPCPATAAMGLLELLVNAVEHGILGISYQQKTQLKLENRWEKEIDHRLALPQHRQRKATVRYTRNAEEIVFDIVDEGTGFDWQQYLDFDPSRAFDPNGRGIAMAAKLAFHELHYQGCGNHATATIRL